MQFDIKLKNIKYEQYTHISINNIKYIYNPHIGLEEYAYIDHHNVISTDCIERMAINFTTYQDDIQTVRHYPSIIIRFSAICPQPTLLYISYRTRTKKVCYTYQEPDGELFEKQEIGYQTFYKYRYNSHIWHDGCVTCHNDFPYCSVGQYKKKISRNQYDFYYSWEDKKLINIIVIYNNILKYLVTLINGKSIVSTWIRNKDRIYGYQWNRESLNHRGTIYQTVYNMKYITKNIDIYYQSTYSPNLVNDNKHGFYFRFTKLQDNNYGIIKKIYSDIFDTQYPKNITIKNYNPIQHIHKNMRWSYFDSDINTDLEQYLYVCDEDYIE